MPRVYIHVCAVGPKTAECAATIADVINREGREADTFMIPVTAFPHGPPAEEDFFRGWYDEKTREFEVWAWPDDE